MPDIVANLLQQAPPTIAVLFVFYLLQKDLIKNSAKDRESSDALIGRLIDQIPKLTESIDKLVETVEKRTEIIEEQTNVLANVRNELREVTQGLQELKDVQKVV